MSALDNKLSGIKKCAELIVKDTDLAISSLEEERNHRIDGGKVWLVYSLDENGFLDYDSICVYEKREDAYGYYRKLATDTLNEYKKRNKEGILLNDFGESTYYLDNRYPEFGIDNKNKGNCHLRYEYEEIFLREFLVC